MNESPIRTTSLGPLSSLDTGIFSLALEPLEFLYHKTVALHSWYLLLRACLSLSGPGVAADRSSDIIYASIIHRSYGVTCIAGRRLSSNLYSIFIPYPRSLPLLISCSGFLSCCTSKR